MDFPRMGHEDMAHAFYGKAHEGLAHGLYANAERRAA